MTHPKAQQLAIELMTEHGLIQAGWVFRWGHGRRQLGSCQILRRRGPLLGRPAEIKVIKLSKHLVALNSDEEVRDTILHEIAHALAGLKNGHNHVWKQVCLRIGAKPQRIAGEEVKTVDARYTLICGCCDQTLGQLHRRPKHERLLRSYCRSCGLLSKGKLRLMERVG